MNRKVVFGVALLMMVSFTAASEFKTSGNDYSFNLNAGSTYQEEVSVEWLGETAVVAEPSTEIIANSTNDIGINVTYNPESVILYPGEPKSVDILIDTHTGLKPDNFTFKTTFSTEYPVKEVDSGGSGGSSGGDDTEIVYRNETETIYENVTDGSLNESQEEDLKERIEDLEENGEKQGEIITNLLGNLTSSQTEADKWESKYNQLSWVTGGLISILVLLVGAILYKERIVTIIQKVK